MISECSPGVMLLNRSTAPRDRATDIKKTFRKDAPEQERPNRSVVINKATQPFYNTKYQINEPGERSKK